MVLFKIASNEKRQRDFMIFNFPQHRRWLRYSKNEIAIDAFVVVVLKSIISFPIGRSFSAAVPDGGGHSSTLKALI